METSGSVPAFPRPGDLARNKGPCEWLWPSLSGYLQCFLCLGAESKGLDMPRRSQDGLEGDSLEGQRRAVMLQEGGRLGLGGVSHGRWHHEGRALEQQGLQEAHLMFAGDLVSVAGTGHGATCVPPGL